MSETLLMRCPECGREFDPFRADGRCTHADCGEYRVRPATDATVATEDCEFGFTDPTITLERIGGEAALRIRGEPEIADHEPASRSSADEDHCPNCGGEIRESWGTCAFCFVDLDEAAHDDASPDGSTDGSGTHDETTGPTGTKVFDHGGSADDSGSADGDESPDMTGSADATNRSVTVNYCPNCGVGLSEFTDPDFCPGCGESIT